ncbi:hypothetical protein ACFVUS_39520 [Nocardia sp. NPDC058058]|uniref:hypothetical protein n=1 Tax=Nocardia sp. NPDC058058 TaxID=3346317 RepID=UPI0036DBE1BF
MTDFNESPDSGNDHRADTESSARPLMVLSIGAGLATITGLLTDWNTASMVFLAILTLYDNERPRS